MSGSGIPAHPFLWISHAGRDQLALAERRRPLPAARIGRSSRAARGAIAVAAVVLAQVAIGGWAPAVIAAALAGLRIWRRLPRVERFRVCARCGCVRDEDYGRSGLGTPTTVCCGTVGPLVDGGEPWCVRLETRLG